MADKAISELVSATSVTPTDLFVLEQAGAAKKLTGQVLENWLLSFADGHGGIQSVVKISSSGLTDTYRITYSDTTTTNFTVKNGAKGDTGATWYTHIKYASVQPTSSSVTLSDTPDKWMGIYAGTQSTPPTSYASYKWYEIKGEKGNTGNAATLNSSEVVYQMSSSGTIIPTGAWYTTVPAVQQGYYLWTRVTLRYNTGSPVVSYSVTRYGMDGSGAVSTVNYKQPDSDGNVQLDADDVSAVKKSGDTMSGVLTFNSGGINMNGQSLTGLNAPSADNDAVTKAFMNTTMQGYAYPKASTEQKKLVFTNKTVDASAFVSDTTYSDFPFMASIALSGVTAAMIPEVVLSVTDAMSGNYAPVAETYAGGVRLYAAAAPSATLTIPTIICWRS